MNITGEIHVHKTETPIADLPVLDEVSGNEKLKVYDNGVAKSVTTGMLIAGATDAISIGIDEDDGLLYLYVNGQKQGEGVEIGGTVTTRYTITYTLDPHMVSSNMATRVAENSSYHAVISSDHVDYQVQNISVTMGGQNITATAVDGNNIDIASVTGNIAITVTALFFASVEVENPVLRVKSGATGTVGVRLHAQPTQEQTVSVMGDGVSLSPATLTFTQSNWNVYQYISVTAGNVDEDTTAGIVLRNSDPLMTDTSVTVLISALAYEDLVDTTIPSGAHTLTADDFESVQVQNYTYLQLKNYNGAYNNVVVPASITYNGASYTPIVLSSTFSGNTLQYITVENGVNFSQYGAVGKQAVYAFSSCTSLVGVKLNMTDILSFSSAFNGCTNLKFVSGLENQTGCTSMDQAFYACSSLEYVQDISALNLVTSMSQTFSNCTALKKIFKMPDEYANACAFQTTFNGCTAIKKIDIPKNATPDRYAMGGIKNAVVNIYNDDLTTSNITSSTFYSATNVTVYCTKNSTTEASLLSAYGSSTQISIKNFGGQFTPYIVTWGDSITSPNTSWIEWPKRLQTKLGTSQYLVKNVALSGEWSTSTTARQGGYVMTTNTFTIPADTSATEITITVDGNQTFSSSPLFTPGGAFNPCKIAGVQGTISRDGSQYYFTRLESGAAVSVPTGSRIVSDNDTVFNSEDNVMIFYLNGNAGWDNDATKLLDMFKKAVAHFVALGGTKYIVAGLANGFPLRTEEGRSIGRQFESLAAEEFGNHWLNLREYGIQYGLTQNNISASDLDTERIAMGLVPASLVGGGTPENIVMYGTDSNDDTHPNAYGSNTIMLGFYEKGVALGYWS